MATSTPAAVKFAPALQWAALAWMLVWVPAYWRTWGAANFIHLCDVAVILTCVGLWTNSALLISSQAVGLLLVDVAWAADAAWRLLLGHHLTGGTEYLFDMTHPLWVRLLSLFHIALLVLLLWAVRRTGYRAGAWALQSGIALGVVIASRFTNPAININYAFRDPFFHWAWGPAPTQVAATVIFLAFVAYLPAHLIFKKVFPRPAGLAGDGAGQRF